MMAEREMRGVCEKGMGGELRAHTQTHAGRYIMREREVRRVLRRFEGLKGGR